MKKSLSGKIAFGVGGAAKDMVYTLSAYYLMYYYQNVLDLSPAFVGTVLMAARLFDALNDPLMGVVVARTRSRWGRLRPWIFSGSILNAFMLYALFAAPDVPETGIMVWFTVVYLLWGITYTMLDIPYWSMIPAAAETGSDQEKLTVIGRTCAGIGGGVIAVLAMIAVGRLGGGNEREGFRLLALIVSCVFLAGEIFCCVMMKERRQEHAAPSAGVKQMFRELIHNDQALTVAGIIILTNVAAYITTNLAIYFFKYDYGGEAWQNSYTLFLGIGSVSLVLGMVLIYPLLRKFQVANEKIFLGSVVTAVAGNLILLAICLTGPSGKFIPLCIGGCMVFAANGLLTVLTTVFLANSVDYGELRTHHRDESVTFSMQTFVVKAASALAVFISGLGLDLIGLVGDAEETGEVIPQSAETLLGLRLLMTLLPVLGLTAAFFCFRKWFRLTDRRMKEITHELHSRQ